MTAIRRTLLDIAATAPGRPLQNAIERAERLGILDLADLDALLVRSPGSRRDAGTAGGARDLP